MMLLSQTITQKPWRWWSLFLALVLAIFLPSLGSAPLVWQDEVQIVDFGRVVLDPGTDWAVTWSTSDQKAVPPISYLGCVAAELAHRVTGGVLGSRLLCIAGGFLLGSLVLALLLQQGAPVLASLLFAALMILDPGLVQDYRAGRLDALAMAFVLGGALCLQRHARSHDWRWLVAGALALACAPYIWLRAVMALPAALLPLIFAGTMPDRKLLVTLLALVGLTAAGAALLLPPAWGGLMMAGSQAYSPMQLFSGLTENRWLNTPWLLFLRMLEDILRCCSLAVPLLLLAAVGFIKALAGKELTALRKVLVGLVVVTTLIIEFKLTTGLHHYTALYLAPLFVLLAQHGITVFAPGGRVRWLVAGMALLLACQVVYNVDQSYGSWLDRASFGPEAVQPVVKALPAGSRRLIVDDFRLYFVLRRGGFKPFYLLNEVNHNKHQFRFYTPPLNGDFQPYYLFTHVDKARHEESFSPDATPGLLVGGSTPMWASYFEPQLRRPSVKQLPLGYRLVVPAPR